MIGTGFLSKCSVGNKGSTDGNSGLKAQRLQHRLNSTFGVRRCGRANDEFEASFGGEHSIKGKSEPQKVFRLDGIREGVSRFDAAVIRGLSSFVGREHELESLERGLTEARSELRVIDISAEPGMGKSRLLHEFRQRIGKERAFVLSGSCSRDGEQTPFLPFIEMVRGLFRVSTGEPEGGVAQKWR
jgi:hypothetical protein